MEELPSGPGWGAAVGSEPGLALAGDGASPSAFALLPESAGVCSPSITWQILSARLQEMQVENCSALGYLGVGKGAWTAVGSCCHPLQGCSLAPALTSPNLLSWLQVKKKEKREKDTFTCK